MAWSGPAGIRAEWRRCVLAPLLFGTAIAGCAPKATDVLPAVVANDNRTPAGTLTGDTLAIHLVIRMAEWRPEADSGPVVAAAVFAEEGKAPNIPGPLIRVKAGTVVSATIRNALTDSTLWLHGFVTRPSASRDSIALKPGESRALTFQAGEPGTYFYWAVPGHHVYEIDPEREQLSGAFIVDPAEGSPPDRILVMNIWGRQVDSVVYLSALAINGRSWPYDERLSGTVGDTIRWRIINPTEREHPMHLHGFYFTVTGHGNGTLDSLYSPDQRRQAVTENMLPFQSIAMSWVPDRPGNWLFHCHIGFHVAPDARLNPPPPESHDRMAHDPTVHMAGLVVGIAVNARAGAVEGVRGEARQLRLLVQEGHRQGRAPRALGFVLQRSDQPLAPDSVEIAGSPLILTRGVPTDITVLNRLKESASVHWHGIELESYSDGVAGWSGAAARLAPSIQPGDSFTARLTLPRAGTFMYHTHMNDLEQLSSGLYGGIIVLEPGARYDPSRDHLYVVGWDSEQDPPHLLVNGDSLSTPPITLAAGVPHRFRLINIGIEGRVDFAIYQDSSLVRWRPVAKDGADLPAAQATSRPSRQGIQVGETFDFEFVPRPGEYRLVMTNSPTPAWTQRLIVR